MSYAKTWSGDWRQRVRERVTRLGFEDLTAYATARPCLALEHLAAELGGDDIAVVQLERLLMDEAAATGRVSAAYRDLVTRIVRAELPQGWQNPLSESVRASIAGAFALLWVELEPYTDRTAAVAAVKTFLDERLPVGWRPEAADDPVIARVVDGCLRSELKAS